MLRLMESNLLYSASTNERIACIYTHIYIFVFFFLARKRKLHGHTLIRQDTEISELGQERKSFTPKVILTEVCNVLQIAATTGLGCFDSINCLFHSAALLHIV